MNDTDLANAIAALGETPDEIAKALQKLGIKGEPGNQHSCPLANYLKPKIEGDDMLPDITEEYTAIRGLPEGTNVAKMKNPNHIQLFILRFDAHQFPDLIYPGKQNKEAKYMAEIFINIRERSRVSQNKSH